jgi:hypothetical protein
MRIAPSSPVQMPLSATLASGVYDLEVDHHPCLVLEYVAVEHVELLALEVVGEVYSPLHSLSRPEQQGVLEAQIR